MRCHPDIELSKANLEVFLEQSKEAPVIFRVGDINDNAHQVIVINSPSVLPCAPDDLRLPCDRAEALSQFQQGVADEGIGHRLRVIKLKWQQYLVAA